MGRTAAVQPAGDHAAQTSPAPMKGLATGCTMAFIGALMDVQYDEGLPVAYSEHTGGANQGHPAGFGGGPTFG